MPNISVVVKQNTQKVSLKISQSLADMAKSVYDTNGDGVVDNAKLANGLLVEKAVPANAKFSDTDNHGDLNLNDGSNPHGTTKSDVGLGNVDNTSDGSKPISALTQVALDLKADDSDLDTLEDLFLNLITTGIKTGGFLTPNTDTTKFDISDGSGLVVDAFSVPENPTFISVTWTGLTAQVPTHIGSENISFIALDSTGEIVQSDTSFTVEQRRDFIVLGTLVHNNNVNITATSDETHDVSSSYLADDFAIAIGDLNIKGNHFEAASTDLTICKTEGLSFKHNSNRKNSLKNPNYVTSTLISPLTFLTVYDDGSSGVTVEIGVTDIDPDSWDNGTGVKATVSANKWTNKWCYFFPSSSVVLVRLGTVEYSTLVDAQTGIINDLPPEIGSGLDKEFIRTVISVKVGSTDLSDVAQAVFFDTGKFGLE